MKTFMHRLHNPDFGILFIRIALAAVFINAGWFKFANMEMVVAGFTMGGFTPWMAYLVAAVELLGGIAMLFGIFTRYAGVLLAIVMLVAMVKVHGPNGFSMANNGYEYVFTLFFASLAMVTLGAGHYSLARLLNK